MPQNRPNPAYGRPVPPGFPPVPPYITPAGLPTNDPGTADTPAPAVAQPPVPNVDIAPSGSAAAPTPAPVAPAATTTTGPAAGPPSPGQRSSGGYTVDQIVAPYQDELLKAHAAVAAIQDDIAKQQQRIDYLTNDPKGKQEAIGDSTLLRAATSALKAQYGAMSSALGRVQTANGTLAKSVTDTIHDGTIDPGQVQVANATVGKANADAYEATTRAKVLLEGSDNQKALTAAQATQASANAAALLATAAATAAKTPAETAQLQAQATAFSAQAKSTEAMIQPLVDKTAAETKLLGSQSDVAQSQVGLNNAQAASQQADAVLRSAQAALTQGQVSAGLPAAQAGLAGGQEAQARAAAEASQADIQKGLQGPLYGLQDQIKAIQAIQQQVFGPGGSGNPQDATDLLNQYVTATVSGTTPYAANVAAANAGLTAFGTQASLANAAQAAAASRANAYTGFGGTVLGQLAAMNANAPAGSTAMAGAFNDVMNQMATRLQAPQFAGGPTPTAPALPALLQKLAPPGADQTTPTGPGPLPGVPAAATAAPGLGWPTPSNGAVPMPQQGAGPGLGGAQPMPQQGPGPGSGGAQPMPLTSAPVTINIGGQAQPAPTWTPPGASYSYSSPPPGTGTTPQRLPAGMTTQMPAVLQQHAPASMNTIAQLWSNELQSGIVRSPYAAMGQAG